MPKRRVTRKDAIEKALGGIYSRSGKTKGTMIEGLALDLDERWEALVTSDGGPSNVDPVEYAVHMVIWNWFSGGGTAEIAAKKVIKAVEDWTAQEAFGHIIPQAALDLPSAVE